MTTTTTPPLSSAITIILTFLIAASSPSLPFVTSSTIAVTYNPTSTTTVCGITAGKPTQSIQCYRNNHTISIAPNVSFESIAGGPDLLCGLRTGGFSLVCWDTTTFLPKRIYYSRAHPLTDLTVGSSQICAIRVSSGGAQCWRSPSADLALRFRAITSGGGFSCGIRRNSRKVTCWGGRSEIGAEIQRQFGNLTMLSLVAGESHACGLTTNGYLICEGSNASGQLDVPFHSAFEFSSLALGSNHSCGILRQNGSVICWGGGKERSQLSSDALKLVSFEVIEAGSDFTCGLTTRNLSVICWGVGFNSGSVLPLAMVIPGPCIQSSCSSCGVFPNSGSLCAGSGNICNSCDIELPIAVELPPLPSPAPPSQNLPPLVADKSFFLAFVIVGSVGALAGICTIVYWLGRRGVCVFVHKKLDKSLQSPDGIGSYVPPTSTNRENLPRLKRQRSGTSWKHVDRAEEFALKELSAATNNFSLENKIGGGSFGTVYKGKLLDGREVAIKRGDIGTTTEKLREKEIEFDSELVSLSGLHHKHLVELVGFCRENDERLLVYEHMSNGSLHEHLHHSSNVEKSSSILNSWKMRIKIALETARGIEYLHNYAVPPIIHRDIKSSNILLDTNWTAKVSDFGFSLMGPESDAESMSTKAVGTLGYIDPEYYALNILTAKSDVYGLGVVLLELLTGKQSVFKVEGSDPMRVVEYARPRIASGELQSVLDKNVGVPDTNEAEAVEVVAYTALKCVNMEGHERPSITDIVVNLERALALCEGGISSTTFSV